MDFETADALNRAIRLIGMKHRGQATVALSKLGLHTGHEVLLLELDARGPRARVELAGALGCEPPSVTLMVQKLEAAGLIRRSTSTRDSRATLVELTDKGSSLMPKLRDVWLRLAETTSAGLNDDSLDDVLKVVSNLANSLYAGQRSGRNGSRLRPAELRS